jgi:hypothetical protein
MRPTSRRKPAELLITHFKTLDNLVELLNRGDSIANRVRSFVKKLRELPQPGQTVRFASGAATAIENLMLQLERDHISGTLEMGWSREYGVFWDIRPNLASDYKLWVWAVVDFDRGGALARILNCEKCGKFFKAPREGRPPKHCSRQCKQRAYRSKPEYKAGNRRRSREAMRKQRIDDALPKTLSALRNAGYQYIRSGTCDAHDQDVAIQWWRHPRARRMKIKEIPVQFYEVQNVWRVRTHWPHA